MKYLFLFITAAFLLSSTTSSFAKTNTNSNQLTLIDGELKTIVIKVKGITCSNDLKTLATNVEKLDGVSKCEVLKSGATAKYEVKYDASVVTEKEIHAAIENTAGCKNPNERPYKVK